MTTIDPTRPHPRRLLSVALLSGALFALAFTSAFFLLGAASALAQPAPPAEAPAPAPSATGAATAETPTANPTANPTAPTASGTVDSQAGSGDMKPGGHPDTSAVHHGHHDPSKHFNFFNFSYGGKDVMGGPYGDGKMVDAHTGETVKEEEAMSPPFILLVVNFALLFGLLAWKAGPALGKLARDRHDGIKTALDEAAKLRQQAADKLAQYESRLSEADAEIKKLVEGMRADAEADKQRILAAAAQQAATMKRDAELRIAAELELARATLTREVTAAATLATEKLLREKLLASDQQKLVSSFIEDVQHVTRISTREAPKS